MKSCVLLQLLLLEFHYFYTNGNAVNSTPPTKITAANAKRELFRPSWHANDIAMLATPMRARAVQRTKYDVGPNQIEASANNNMSTNHIGTNNQLRIFSLFIVLRF